MTRPAIRIRSQFRATCPLCRRPIVERARLRLDFRRSNFRRGPHIVSLSMSRWVHEDCPPALTFALEEARARRIMQRTTNRATY